uniref:Midasin n=1 Tax=Globisporangium ultimum (strain ATCC 200006 / CBS 805.95 / DAOM BR144) TaxID=431595 RepID=K3X0F1_GLOUD
MRANDSDNDQHSSMDPRNDLLSVQRLRSGLRHAVADSARLQQHPALQRVLTAFLQLEDSNATPHDDTATTSVLQAIASCLVHDECIGALLTHLRPFVMDAIVRLMEPSIVLYEETTDAEGYALCVDPMKRSELVAAALATVLTFIPQTLNVVQQYFLDSPCFFEFVNVAAAQSKQQAADAQASVHARLRHIVKTAYRLVRLYPHAFRTMWNWSGFFPLCFHADMRIRWYAARTTAVVLQMSNAQRNTFVDGLNVGEGAAASGKQVDVRAIEIDEYKHEVHQQEARIRMSVYEEEASDAAIAPRTIPFHESLKNIFGVVVPTNKQHQPSETSPAQDALVPTTSTKRNLQSLAIALGLKRPILVAGPGGCGKTASIRELARLSGNGDMVELHLDDQIDSKTLLGSYVCTDIPGEFTWQPGALTTAVQEGRWVVIEDIDRAPFEVLAALMPLLETREMVIPGRGELLVAHSNFQIFGTTCHGHNMPKGFQESIWTNVDVLALHDDEIQEILQTRFAKIPRHLIAKIMTTYNLVSGNAGGLLTVPNTTAAALAHLWKETRRNYGRDFCLRDLLKWCKRIYSFCYSSANASTSNEYVTEDERLRILLEALDVFCTGIRDPNTRLRAAQAIASIWDVPDEKVRYVLEQSKPHVAFNQHEVVIGRVHLPTLSAHEQQQNHGASSSSSVVMTGHVLRLLEKLSAIVYTCEPALLIGETGCGKTTIIQHLAASLGQKLVVQNLNIQSDSSDLVGGFKPVEIHLLARPLYMSFVDLFSLTFSQKSNASFLNIIRIAFEHKDWKKMVKGMRKAIQMAASKLQPDDGDAAATKGVSSKAASPNVMQRKWEEFDAELVRFERQKEQVESHFAFAFVEGVLVKALRDGHWVLLDEINLASSDTLERISTLLEHETSAFSITERGDVEVIRPHPNFRIFGAMNPSTDVGKKDLPPSLRNRFTEIYVDECVSPSDLQMVVQHHLKEIAGAPVTETVDFYLEARKQAEERLSDGARHKPRYSLRTLSQALSITRILIQRGYGVERAMYEGFSSSFCTQLDMDSRAYLEKLIRSTFAKKMKSKDLARAPPRPGGKAMANEFVLVSSYWVRQGGYMDPRDDSLPDPVTNRKKFVLTKSVDENLRHLARSALIGKYPVLLQGPTSAGKTSLISYLAARIGQKCVRINNHEHTDIQEYLGSYVSDSNGKLAFKEGVLVEAVRNGWWIILDELNLAPSEVLEALNRLLDDNRELFLPETQETVKPHPKFMLFATQNPPGLYGGRKVLSRAFRNRFLEIQVDEVATSELQTILQERSFLPPSYCAILIDIMRQLQLIRQQSSVFAGKGGFITTRDLLRWAERRPATKQALAEEGYCLLAERLRKDEEKEVVKQVLEQKCNVKIDVNELYYRGTPRESNLLNENGEVEQETIWGTAEQFERVQQLIEQAINDADGGHVEGNAAGLEKISVTKSLRRLFSLVGRCLQHEEPVLLVGETGCGKTTVCQLYSLLLNQRLHILNCHQHTETSDFLGCLRPVRGKEKIAQQLQDALVEFLTSATDDEEEKQELTQMTNVSALLSAYERTRASVLKQLETDDDGENADMAENETRPLFAQIERIDNLKRRFQSIFEWCDGPLVESMKNGDLILVDEVNLAEDAVLERLNSVLEPSRGLLLAEKGGDQVEEITADPKWRIMATMNPGGDFGKRELSPALRNRFTEIWVPAISDLDDIATIIRDRLLGNNIRRPAPESTASALAPLCDPILQFVQKFNVLNGKLGGVGAVTLRDILSWIHFITSVMQQESASSSNVSPWTAFVQGAALSILDGLGLGSDSALNTAMRARDEAYTYLLELVPNDDAVVKASVLASLNATKQAIDDRISNLNSVDQRTFGIYPFVIPRGPDPTLKKPSFSLKAPTTMSNLYRVLRAMQVSRPIILEGSPGVGKTSLISALASASGHRLVRINLSEQTDISDLFGSDLPAASNQSDSSTAGESKSDSNDGSSSGMFEWCDGVFLRALKAGDWVLLDELNLASQSVLEGLNSCLDHRGTVYIPELDRAFECPPTFRVFAAQNPLRQGGGRKGLPKSFLNRFTRVFVETLHEQDLIRIASSMYPLLATTDVTESTKMVVTPATLSVGNTKSLLEKMIAFNSTVHTDTMVACKYGRMGAPWEFNLRDVFRFCELLQQHQHSATTDEELQALRYFVNFIYVERMRSPRDRALISLRFEEFFGVKPMDLSNVSLRISETHVEIGNAFLKRRQALRVQRVSPPLFNFLLKPMEALAHCVNMNWPALLVGPPASGKTSAVRLLAALSGNTLHELGMSAGTDATELLGCFEQVDIGRKAREIKHKVASIYEQITQALVLASSSHAKTATKKQAQLMLKQVKQLSSTWWALCKRERDAQEGSGKSKRKKLTKGQLDDALIDLLRNLLSSLRKAVATLSEASESGVYNGASALLASIQILEQEIDQVVTLSKSASISSSFEWVDGTLIQAMEKGEWILLDNVNFCSSSVLDRLNSLMETGGELLINECGVIDGKLRVIRPHPKFRIFLAMDAQFGEVSRAMRNRCVEIALLEEDEQRLDLIKVASASGIPGFALGRAFQSIHERVLESLASNPQGARYARINRRHLENWSQLASTEINRGIAPIIAIGDAFRRVYGNELLVQLGLEMEALKTFQLALAAASTMPCKQRVFPTSMSTLELCQEAETVMLKRDQAYVEYLFALSTPNADSTSDDVLLSCLASNASLASVAPTQEQCEHTWLASLGNRRGQLKDNVTYRAEFLDEAKTHLSSSEFLTNDSSDSNPMGLTLVPFALRRIVQVSVSSFGAASSTDRLLFSLEKISTLAQHSPALIHSSELANLFVKSLLQNDVYMVIATQMRSLMNQLIPIIGEHKFAEAADKYPVYLSANDAVFQQVRSVVLAFIVSNSEKKNRVEAIWKSILSAQEQLQILDGSEWLRFCEQEQYRSIDRALTITSDKKKRSHASANDNVDLTTYSVLQQSYAIHKYQADRSSVENELVFLLFPFFQSFDAFVACYVQSSDVVSPHAKETSQLVKTVLRDRFELSIQLRNNTFDWTHFLIHWQWTKKSMQRLGAHLDGGNTRTKWTEPWHKVVDTVQRIQDMIEKLIGCGSKKDVLWKHGGHSLLPTSPELWNARYLLDRLTKTYMKGNAIFSPLVQQHAGNSDSSMDGVVDVLALLFGGVASMEAAMKTGRLDVSSLFFVDVAARKEILYALCAFSYLTQQRTNAKKAAANGADAEQQPHAKMAEELYKLPSMLLKKLREKQAEVTEMISNKTLYLSEIEGGADNHVDLLSEEDSRIGKDAPVLLFDMKESSMLMERLVQFQLSPLLEHALAHRELYAISRLLHAVNQYQLGRRSDDDKDNEAQEQFLTSVVHDVASVLDDLDALIDDLLALGMRDPTSFHAYQDIVWCGHKFINASGEANATTTQERHDLRVELDTFVNVVKSHFNAVLFGFHQFLRCNSFNHMDMISLDTFDTHKKLRRAGSKRGKRAASSEEEEQIHAVEGLPRLFQNVQSAVVLKSVAEVDLHESTCGTIEAQVRSLRLDKIKEHFTKNASSFQTSARMVATTRELLMELFVSTVLAFEATFRDKEQWTNVLQLLQSLDNDSNANHLSLLAALKQSSDVTFVATIDEFVRPFLATFSTSKSSLSENVSASSCGESFVLLGLWRFILLVPASPVDPVTKPLVKKEMLLSRLAMLTLQNAVDSAIDRINPLPSTPEFKALRVQEEFKTVYEDVVAVSAYAVQRYQPSITNEELKPVTTSKFGEIFSDLLRFEKTIMPASKMLALLSTVRTSLTSQQKCHQVLRELDMFQQTSESFVAQLETKYGASFRDILEPISSAIFAVKEGVALLVWSIYGQLQEQTVKVQEKRELALSLVAFPSSVVVQSNDNSNNNVNPWRAIQQLLQTVGTKTTSLVFGGASQKRKSEIALLDVALAKLEFLFRETVLSRDVVLSSDAASALLEDAIQCSKALFDLFLVKWQEQQEREAEKRRAEEELFKYKVRTLEIESEDQLLEQEYREQFPDYSVSDFQAFLSPEQAAAAGGAQDALTSSMASAADADVMITDKTIQRLCEAHIKLYAASGCSKVQVTKSEIVHAFARAFSLAVMMRKTINTMESSKMETAIVGSGIFAASLVQSRLGTSSSDARSAVPSLHALNSEYLRGIDFHRDPFVKEVVLVARPLQDLMIKVQSLLALWPDHAILQQLVLIADRIRNFEISSPLARTLTGVELLLRKAQEWEAYAARQYSIANELGALSALVTRWRKLELYSWPHLLHVKERQHRLVAHKTWFSMYSLLTAQFEADQSEVIVPSDDVRSFFNVSGAKNELQWLHLNHLSEWVFVQPKVEELVKQIDSARHSEQQQRWMSELFSTLDAYVRSCSIGQYESRLLIIYSFCAQLFMEFWGVQGASSDASAAVAKKSTYALATMLYHLYRYYEQHLGYMGRQWSGLKAPIQRKLIEYVKICRWDEQTYYSLAESAEKSHRKLMKYVRDYDAVLTVPMQTIIDASTDNGISKEGGFVGIHATRAELDDVSDGVFVPKDDEKEEAEDGGEGHEGEEGDVDMQESDEPKKKKVVPVKKEEEEVPPPRASVLLLVHDAQRPEIEQELSRSPLMATSTYLDKLPVLSKRISKYTHEKILARDVVTARQQPRELCEDLCETIFYRMHKLQHAKNMPKGSKKKALIDLLSELKAQGMSYHRAHLPVQQQQMELLFELDVPDVENCIQLDGLSDLVAADDDTVAGFTASGSKKKSKKDKRKGSKKKAKAAEVSTAESATAPKDSPLWLWQRADAYYYRFISQLTSLRFSALTSFSHDLSSSEVDRMNGYAENMLHGMLQHRQLLHAASLNHEAFIDGISRLERLKVFCSSFLQQTQDSVTTSDLQTVLQRQTLQYESVLSLQKPMKELEIVVAQVLQAASSPLAVSMKQTFGLIFDRLNAISKSFAESNGLPTALGVPAISPHAARDGEDNTTTGELSSTTFASPRNRVYGLSPALTLSGSTAARENVVLPVAADTLQANATRFAEIAMHVADLSTLFAQVAPSLCFNDITAALDRVIEQDKMLQHESTSGNVVVMEESASDDEVTESVASFGKSYDRLVETVLVAIQDLTKLSQIKSADDGDESNDETLRNQLSRLTNAVKDSRVNFIASQFSELLSLLSKQYQQLVRTSSPHWKDAFVSSLTLLERLEPSLLDVRAISRQLLIDVLVAHKSVTKLDFVLIRIFRNLYQHGFCRTEDKE